MLNQTTLFSSQPLALNLPDAEIVYFSDFITNPDSFFNDLKEQLVWQQDTIQLYGRPVLIPRLNAWYGDCDATYAYSGLTLSPRSWTKSLLELKAQLEQVLDTRFNSVLANYYRDGSDSVAWHSDDEPELGVDPIIASLSFGATRRFSLRHKHDKKIKPYHFDLEAGSLLVMAGTTQHFWHHQIAKTRKPVSARINLTFRKII